MSSDEDQISIDNLLFGKFITCLSLDSHVTQANYLPVSLT